MMSKEAIEKIESMSPATIHVVDGVEYSDRKLFDIKPTLPILHFPEELELHTLSGVVDYCKGDYDDESRYLIHIESFQSVAVYGGYILSHATRKRFLYSKVCDFGFRFGDFYEQEFFIINLLAHFQESSNLEKLLNIVCGVRDEHLREFSDSGISQRVAIKTGITMLQEVDLPNPVCLIPQRTFVEIDQIESSYILRMKKTDNGVSFALFEADGGLWMLEAIHRISNFFLKSNLGDNVAIIA